MIYELRVYHIHPGQMDAIARRFADHTLLIFPRHGIKVRDFWVDAEGKNTIFYLCEFESLDAKRAAWASFQADPEWIAVKERSESAGPIVVNIESYAMEDAPFFKAR